MVIIVNVSSLVSAGSPLRNFVQREVAKTGASRRRPTLNRFSLSGVLSLMSAKAIKWDMRAPWRHPHGRNLAGSSWTWKRWSRSNMDECEVISRPTSGSGLRCLRAFRNASPWRLNSGPLKRKRAPASIGPDEDVYIMATTSWKSVWTFTTCKASEFATNPNTSLPVQVSPCIQLSPQPQPQP